jgi:hypothetical protein
MTSYLILRITQDLYDKKYKEYRQTQSELQGKMNHLQKADDEYYITCTYLLKLASKAGELFESSEPDEKREILKLLLQNCTMEGTSLRYDLKKPFDVLFDLGSRHIWLARWDDFRTFEQVRNSENLTELYKLSLRILS